MSALVHKVADETGSVINSSGKVERGIVIVGERGAGKSSVVNILLEKEKKLKPTFGIDYTFCRRHHKDGGKDLCHIWEVGGFSSELFQIVLRIATKSLTTHGLTVVIVIDANDISSVSRLKIILDSFSSSEPSLLIVCCTCSLNACTEAAEKLLGALRHFTAVYPADLLCFDKEDPKDVKIAKEVLYKTAFGTPVKSPKSVIFPRVFLPLDPTLTPWQNRNSADVTELWKILEQLDTSFSFKPSVPASRVISDLNYKEVDIDSVYAQKLKEVTLVLGISSISR